MKMAQWMNLYRNNSFVNQTRLPLLCEKSGAILPSASGSYGRQASTSQTKSWYVDLKILYRMHH